MRMPKIAVIGSRQWSNRTKVKDLIFELKNKFGPELTIVSGGEQNGADMLAKKYAIELGVKYSEYNPAYTKKNLYSAMPDYYYGKQYHVTQLHHRNNLIAENSDYCIALIPKDCKKANGTASCIKMFKRLNKKVIILE